VRPTAARRSAATPRSSAPRRSSRTKMGLQGLWCREGYL
jgi:hypothetical protein